MNNYNNIPIELRDIPQWVVWRFEDGGGKKPTKVPYDPKTGEHASHSDLATWSDFITAFNKLQLGGYDGLGFVFSEHDPYAFIDLDDCSKMPDGSPNPNYQEDVNRQLKIAQEFDSYSEISPSGNGLHIIVRGKLQSGRRRSKIEMYSSQRYATMTGNIYNSRPIVSQQEKLTMLWEQMGSGPATTVYKGDERELLTDDEVITQALNAVNGDKFEKLNKGQWQDLYTSQSEADLAFINIIAFYTQNTKQIQRIFRLSPLGATPKGKFKHRGDRFDYVQYMVLKSFDQMLPPIDFDGLENALNFHLEKRKESFAKSIAVGHVDDYKASDIPIPPGLVQHLTEFIYRASPRPVKEIALAGALGLMAGICGRAYNVSNTGLNQYILLLAKTGIGKESMRSGMDKLLNAVRMQVPTVDDFIGPEEIASGQALVKFLHNKSQCFVSILGEFGSRIALMAGDHASPADETLKRQLLSLYNKSGSTDVYRASIYADQDKNSKVTQSPAFSVLGESVPETVYGSLTEDMITNGLLPRFLLIEYRGKREYFNNEHASIQPPVWLVNNLSELTANCCQLMHAKKTIHVQLDAEARKLADDYDRFTTDMINNTNDEVRLNLWNRAHVKVLKLASLVAVGIHPYEPVITADTFNWAKWWIEKDIKALFSKFEKGDVGITASEGKQLAEVVRVVKEYVVGDYNVVAKYCDRRDLHMSKIIPKGYVSKRLISTAAFRHDKIGATNAINRAIKTLCEQDKLRQIGALEMTTRFGTTQQAFMVSNMRLLDE